MLKNTRLLTRGVQMDKIDIVCVGTLTLLKGIVLICLVGAVLSTYL